MLLDNSKLAKVLALVDSPNAGESQAAINRVTVLLQSAGRTWRDLPEIMGAPHARDFEDFCEEQEPGYKAGQAEELRQKQRQEAAAFLKDVITRYGSRRAALAPSPMERAVDRAVAPFVREQKCEDLNGHFPTTTLDGWWQLELPAPDHVQEAVVRALPLPKTIREALDEYDAWQLRERELQVLRGSRPDTSLSLGCQLRKQFIDMMLSFELEAASIEDVMIRLEVLAERVPGSVGMEVVLNELANLSAKEEAGECAFQIGRVQTATERRTEVQRLLSNVDTAGLSDREIARRVGVSPQTVGNIRRRMVNP